MRKTKLFICTLILLLPVSRSLGRELDNLPESWHKLKKTITNYEPGFIDDCTFGTPTANALPSINTSFQNVFVLGNGGPDLSNVTNFTINWDLSNSGLYQFSMNTNNGNPNWYVDLRNGANHNFNAAQPAISLTGTGFPGFDGDYYATIDQGNFILVSQTGSFTIYFSKSSTAPDCGGVGEVNGGKIEGGPFSFIVDDGQSDTISGITLSSNVGTNSQWVITDSNNIIQYLPNSPGDVNFEGDATGTSLIWHLSYEDGLSGLAVGNPTTSLNGEFDFSNSIEIIKRTDTGSEDCSFGTPIAEGLPSMTQEYTNIFVLGNGGPNLDNISNFRITWSLENNGLYQFSMGTTDGVPGWYVDLLGNISHTFGAANASANLTNTGIPGFDGDYYVNREGDNFIMVSKNGDFTIYYSTSSIEPECSGSANNHDPIARISATPEAGEPPLTVNFDASRSNDPDSDTEILTFAWNFGDGSSASGEMTSHEFVEEGEYTVVLTVTDEGGRTGQATKVIKVQEDIVTPPGPNEYYNRFNELKDEFYSVSNGYFSSDGSPHHSIETLIVEAPDHGHESTSELYSYWLQLEVMDGKINKDWTGVGEVWDAMEKFIIPSQEDQPTNSVYNPTAPATYAAEFPEPNMYPSPLQFGLPVGEDPVSADLSATYGPEIYQMHWLLDNDNFYGYGNHGDGTSTPSYINTFQRGEQESVFETIPHPSWEDFTWGGEFGFLPFFTGDPNYAQQWRYTSAPDADARVVQAMYWAQEYAKEQGVTLSDYLGKASKMGDFLRLAMFDKYFMKMGAEGLTPGKGYESAHYLMSWYIAWGGATPPAEWAWRISSSHCHFGYQNPVAAYALTNVNELKPKSQSGESDWNTSLQRMMEFYTWLQSREGAIAGGATNSWNGDYSPYPAGKSKFYGMAYDDNPVYHDPGSGTWFGWQAWSMERVAEYYYITNDQMAKNLMDKWATWVKSVVKLVGDDDFEIPATLEWTGEPDDWNPSNPGNNSGLSVKVVGYGKDLGIAASTAKALIYYAAATRKHAVLDTESRDLAKEILDRMWHKYRDEKGVSALETRGDFNRMFEQEVYVPSDYSGVMSNGDEIKSGVTFLDIRSGYKDDPEFARFEEMYNSGQEYTQRYHRSWAQIEVALANAEYGHFFSESEGKSASNNDIGISVNPNPVSNFVNITGYAKLKGATIKVLDIAGNTVKSKTFKEMPNTTQLSLGGLSTGLYIIEITDTITGEKFNHKIIKR